MKIVYMGTPDFAVEALEALVSSKHEVIAVFTQPDKPKGRGKAMQFTPVKEVAVRENIPVYQPQKIRDPEVVEQIRALVPDHTAGNSGYCTLWMHQCAWFSSSKIPRGCPDPVGSDRRRKGIGSYHHADGCRPGYRRYAA